MNRFIEEYLCRQAPRSMEATFEKETLENFVSKHAFPGLSGAAVLDSNSQTVFVLIAGIYATVEEAEQAYAKLNPPLTGFQPWIRSLESLRKALSTQ